MAVQEKLLAQSNDSEWMPSSEMVDHLERVFWCTASDASRSKLDEIVPPFDSKMRIQLRAQLIATIKGSHNG